MNTVTELLQPVENDLDDLILELKNLIGAGHPILQAAAVHLFSAGKKVEAWNSFIGFKSYIS